MKRRIIGLMSGTSVDAIDAALVEVTTRPGGGYDAKVLKHVEQAWPPALRQRLLAVMAPATATIREICELNVRVAELFAKSVEKLLVQARVPRTSVTAIGSHGQTIAHYPPAAKAAGTTLQIGDIPVLATLTGITTVGNFRPADMAVGGQGAPLVPWTDAALLTNERRSRCVQNIGGIANVTYLPRGRPGGGAANVLAFDTGPGNMLLDAVASLATDGKQRFDRGGRMAARGTLDQRLFRELQMHPYFDRKPPKSTGREAFGLTFARTLLKRHPRVSSSNLLCTLTRLTAWSIADAYLHFLPEIPDEVILCGGGADNPLLVQMLREELAILSSDDAPVAVGRIDEFGIPNKAKEAASFALLAAATLDGVPANLPGVTGAARPVVLGAIAHPSVARV